MQLEQITAYSLIDFAMAMEKAFQQGFRLDVETNERVPQQIGSLMVCTLVKFDEVVLEPEVQPKQVEEARKQAQRGRKPNNIT